jgi:hypothetical protein
VIGAVSRSAIAAYIPAGISTAVLEVRLERYKAQLSDWVNCASCNTPEGKTKIAQISARIAEIEAQLKSAEIQKQDGIPVAGAVNAAADTGRLSAQDTGDNNGTRESALTAGEVGGRLDVYG